jgi:hypothetical protein
VRWWRRYTKSILQSISTVVMCKDFYFLFSTIITDSFF